MAEERQENPVQFLVGCLVGSVLVMGSVGGEKDQEVYEFDAANGGILLFTPTASLTERMINRATGNAGYSHVGMLLGLTNDSNQVLIADSQPARGVKALPLKTYHGRRIAFIPLDDRTLAHARGAALSRMGAPYRGRKGGLTCGEFVYSCLPRKYQQQMKEKGNFTTPNSIARAFGVPTGGTETVGDLARRLRF